MAVPQKTPFRNTAKQETREALVAAALAEFAQRGLDAPSLDAICARAGYTRGAFYVHFRDRDDLVVAAMERVLGAFLDGVIGRGDGAPDLEAAITRFASILRAARGPTQARRKAGGTEPSGPPLAAVPFHRLLEACVRSPAIRERFVSIQREAIARMAKMAGAGQAAGRLRSNVDADALATVLLALALGAIAALEVGLPLDIEGTRRAVVSLLAS